MALAPRIHVFVAVVTIAALTSRTAASDNIQLRDGTMLLHMCEIALNPHMTRGDLPDHMYLMGYIRGFTEADSRDAEYEIPPTVTPYQTGRAIEKWLDDHPKMLDQPPRVLILRALKDAYPAKHP